MGHNIRCITRGLLDVDTHVHQYLESNDVVQVPFDHHIDSDNNDADEEQSIDRKIESWKEFLQLHGLMPLIS